MPKFVATKSFRNTNPDQISLDFEKDNPLDLEEEQHLQHVHKGALFVIGPPDMSFSEAVAAKRLTSTQVDLIKLLKYTGCIGDGSDTALVAKMRKELKTEIEHTKQARSAVASGSSTDVVNQLVAALKGTAKTAPTAAAV